MLFSRFCESIIAYCIRMSCGTSETLAPETECFVLESVRKELDLEIDK